jgi:hypothetical protein
MPTLVQLTSTSASASRSERDGPTRAAGPDDHRRPRQRDAVVVQRPHRADGVGVVSAGHLTGEVDGVDRADAFRQRVRIDGIQYVLFERDGDVQPRNAQLSGRFDGRRAPVCRRLEGDVLGVDAEFFVPRLVHRRGQRMAHRVADESVDVHTVERVRPDHERHGFARGFARFSRRPLLC